MVTPWSGLCHSLCVSRFNSWKSWHGEINFFCFFLTHLPENYLMFNISSRCNIMGTCANTKMEYDLKGLNSKKLIRKKMTNTFNFSPWCTLLLYQSCLRPPTNFLLYQVTNVAISWSISMLTIMVFWGFMFIRIASNFGFMIRNGIEDGCNLWLHYCDNIEVCWRNYCFMNFMWLSHWNYSICLCRLSNHAS